MDLPDNIKSRVADYLNLEFGESSIAEDDLSYIGFENDRHYWTFSSSNNNYWAFVEPYEGSFLISMTIIKPDLK